jgi:hypothetical protein
MGGRKLISILTFILGFSLLTSSISAAKIIENYAPAGLVIQDFVLVSSNQKGNILTRTFKLKVENTSQEPLSNVKFTLIHTSDQATINEGEVYIGTINPGQTLISNDDFTYSVNTWKSKIIPEINLHWSIEYEDAKGRQTREALVKEKF